MALSETDRTLLQRCLARSPRAWDDFVDRFTGLVIHVVNHTAECRSWKLSEADRDDLVAAVMLAIVNNDFALLRHFRGNCSLATYLTVVSRRVVVHSLLKMRATGQLAGARLDAAPPPEAHQAEPGRDLGNRDEIERLLEELDQTEAAVVRLYHLEGKSYGEISSTVGMPENSIGPLLSRARQKMRASGSR